MKNKKYQIVGKLNEVDSTCNQDIPRKGLSYDDALQLVLAKIKAHNYKYDDTFYHVDENMWLSQSGMSIKIEEMK